MAGPRWNAAANFGYFVSDLDFGDGASWHIQEAATTATLEYRMNPRWTLQTGAGAVVGGSLTTTDRTYTITPGWEYSVAVSFRVLDGQGYFPFILVSTSVSASGTATLDANGNRTPLVSIDTGVVLTAGKTFFRVLSPYLMGRVFGGPIFWHQNGTDVTGTDRYHYQLGAGVVLSLFRRLDLYVEGVPLGERRISGGAGFSF